MSALTIVDALAALLEPTQANRDDSAARPVVYLPSTLYAWPRNEKLTPDGDGSIDQRDFRVRVAWAADAGFEVAAGQRDRATSQAIQAKADALEAIVRANRTNAQWENIQVDAVDYETLVTNAVRGFYMDISGYLLTI